LSEQKVDLLFHRGDLVMAVPDDKIGIVADDVPKTHSFADILLDGTRSFIHVHRIKKVS